MSSTVYVVHCIDTEGPLYESIEATFERLRRICNVDIEPSEENLKRLQEGKINLGGKEQVVREILNPRLLNYQSTWDQIDNVLKDALSESFRTTHTDSQDNGWIYNWFCVDHVDYEANPRRKDMGFHNVFDHYKRILEQTNSIGDSLHFHFHPHSLRNDAHRTGAHWWANSNALYQILSRRIIERNWFPCANRPGFHVIRPESNWFLEQYIPFDFSNQSVTSSGTEAEQLDFALKRSQDWKRAPRTWSPYHPSHDDHESRGKCRRWIARCLNIGTRYNNLTKKEVKRAFREAKEGKPVVLSFNDHDYRDIRPDVNEARDLIVDVSEEFPNVPFEFSEAVGAMRDALSLPERDKCVFQLDLEEVSPHMHALRVYTDEPTFGPQPFLAMKTHGGNFYHDNFDIIEPFHEWSYVYDKDTLPFRSVDKIGVAGNNDFGVTTVATMNPSSRDVRLTYHHEKIS